MIKWINDISEEDKFVVESLINRVNEVNANHLDISIDAIAAEFNLRVEEGGFSDIFFYKDYALKYTSSWDYELDNEELRTDLILQSDGEVVSSLKQFGGFDSLLPTIYAENANWVVMDRMKGRNLAEIYLEEKKTVISDDIEAIVLPYIENCINAGWYPLDLRMRCIYPEEPNGLKIIDFNLYQTVSHLQEENADIDWTLPTKELAEELYFWETASCVG